MHLQDHGRVGRDRSHVVGKVRLVRGADFHHSGVRLRHDVGDAERPADLDELAARDDSFVTCGEFGEHHHDCCGVVVHSNCGLGAGERADELLAVGMARAASHRVGVVFQRRVPACDLVHGLHGGGRENASPEVGVDDDAACVHDAPQGRTVQREKPHTGRAHDARDGRVGVAPCKDSLPRFVDARTYSVAYQVSGNAIGEGLERGIVEDFLNLRKRAELIVRGLRSHECAFRARNGDSNCSSGRLSRRPRKRLRPSRPSDGRPVRFCVILIP